MRFRFGTLPTIGKNSLKFKLWLPEAILERALSVNEEEAWSKLGPQSDLLNVWEPSSLRRGLGLSPFQESDGFRLAVAARANASTRAPVQTGDGRPRCARSTVPVTLTWHCATL